MTSRQLDIDEILASAVVFSLPMVTRFRRVSVREGVLLQGPAGWAEFAPFDDYDDLACVPWLAAALDTATHPWPEPLRPSVPINVTVPVVSPERAAAIIAASGCGTAKVKVADPGVDPVQDAERLAAVREAIGQQGAIRIDANAAWDVATAIARIEQFASAAGGLQYCEQPCRTIEELATVHAETPVPIAADESIRLATDPIAVARAAAADIAVLKVAPLGGVTRTVQIAAEIGRISGMRVVISSAVDSAVGIAAGLAAAAALPVGDDEQLACGLGTGSLLASDVCADPPRPVGGLLPVTRTAPPPDAVDRVRADPATSRHWLDRLSRVAALLVQVEE